jgi:hypothetical protein
LFNDSVNSVRHYNVLCKHCVFVAAYTVQFLVDVVSINKQILSNTLIYFNNFMELRFLPASILRIYVTWQDTNVRLPDDDIEMSKHVGVYRDKLLWYIWL